MGGGGSTLQKTRKVGRGKPMEDLVNPGKGFAYYFKCKGKPLKCFEEIMPSICSLNQYLFSNINMPGIDLG